MVKCNAGADTLETLTSHSGVDLWIKKSKWNDDLQWNTHSLWHNFWCAHLFDLLAKNWMRGSRGCRNDRMKGRLMCNIRHMCALASFYMIFGINRFKSCLLMLASSTNLWYYFALNKFHMQIICKRWINTSTKNLIVIDRKSQNIAAYVIRCECPSVLIGRGMDENKWIRNQRQKKKCVHKTEFMSAIVIAFIIPFFALSNFELLSSGKHSTG